MKKPTGWINSGGGKQIFPNLISTHYSWWFDSKNLVIDFQAISWSFVFHFSLSSKYPWNSWFQFLVGQSSSWVRKQKPSGNINRIVLFRGSKISNYEQAMNKIMKTSQVKSKIWYLVLTCSHVQRSCSTLVVNLWSLCALCRVRKQKDFCISASMSKFAGARSTVLVSDIPWINKFELFPE